ncbi:MAG TPA: inorganic phosphate transporter [Succinivibrionaceae bacterium]|nr:inorganic phosphate transporter [Succinivibrionaceae bacterium]
MLESLFVVLVGCLLALAVLDLFVGVSNDAVNFLNSAVGTRIAPLYVVMAVASVGVLLGATFSSGMMEVARKGMFHPEMFSYAEIMMIFGSVMISDILLLNLFNSLGLPTSTTVSIVFELLGAAVFASFYKLYTNGVPLVEIFTYVKLDRTATIVSAILLSVVIAFICGMAVQFLCRIFFTFWLNRTVKYYGGIFMGLSITAIMYFLLIKGAKHASFMKPEYVEFIDANVSEIMWGIFAVSAVLGQILALAKVNIFRIIILSGTFALAFSFAGNDLVNFIGVPLAALDSYKAWSVSEMPSVSYMMEVLNENTRSDSIFLFLAGVIMCVTLWTSKKARRVVQTSINLSSSSSGEREQFGASTLGRVLTRGGLGVSRAVYAVLPDSVISYIGKRYRKLPVVKGQIPLPFDYVRASINLVLASALISMATSFKLPLSTTYVTFMVAMGSSFADGAWDRESAVYRISGVITVVAGWFLTGICAFSFACFISFLVFSTGLFIEFALIICVFGVVVYTNFIRKSKTEKGSSILKAMSDAEILSTVTKAVPNFYDLNMDCIKRGINAFFEDNEFKLRKTRNKASNVQEEISQERSSYYSLALDDRYGSLEVKSSKNKSSGTIDAKFFYYLVFSNMREASKSVRYALDQAVDHVANRHTIFGGAMRQSLIDLVKRIERISQDMHAIGDNPTAENVENIVKHAKKLNRDIDRCQMNLVSIIGKERVSMHSSEIYLTFLQSIRDMANRYVAVSMQGRALAELVENNAVMTPIDSSQLQTEVMPASLNSHKENMMELEETESETSETIYLPKSPAQLEAESDSKK